MKVTKNVFGSDGFTAQELEMAKKVDLVKVAEALGFTPKRIGNFHTLKEMDSIRIYNHTHWYRFSNGTGGSQIDFLKVFTGSTIKEAVAWLLDFAGYQRMNAATAGHGTVVVDRSRFAKTEPEAAAKKEFVLPERNSNNDRLVQYLSDVRGLSDEVIDYFLSQDLIYETKQYHNICFLGNDPNGVTRHAFLRGTYEREGKKPFKMDVAGNDKRYGFNVYHEHSSSVVVTEGAIDAMSYVMLTDDYDSSLLAMGMVNDNPLEQYLKDHPDIDCITFALDNDAPGREASEKLIFKYAKKGYLVRDFSIPDEYKDLNEWVKEESFQPGRSR